MQAGSGDNTAGVTAAVIVASLANRRPQAMDAPSQNLMRIYLDKLKDLVPMCPKNKNVSKLELIQHVIDYINDLQETLQKGMDESPPPSPTVGPVDFSEAFSQLGFDDSLFKGHKLIPPERTMTASPGSSYTSEPISDCDSRGSSPVNSQSDTEFNSDEHPMLYGVPNTDSEATPKVINLPSHLHVDYYSYNDLLRNSQNSCYQRGDSHYSLQYHTG